MLEVYFTNQYVRAFVMFLVVFIVLKFLIVFIGRILPKLVSKTKTNIDDVILEKTSGPFTIIAILVGIRLSIGEIDISESWNTTLESVLMTLIIFVGAILVYYVVDSLIVVGMEEFGNKSKKKVNESLLQFFHSILKITIVISAFLVILSDWGIKIGPLLAGLGVAGIAIAFALQSTLSNVFGGISMLLDKSINVGDLVRLDAETSGKILKINLRSTKIRTFDNELIIVPNGKLAESNIQNVALPEPKTRVVVPFGVAYGSNIKKVKELVMRELVKINNFIDNPRPVVRFLEMADSALSFKAYFYVNTFDNRLSALDEANTRIYNILNKNNISIPFPQMDVYLRRNNID